MNDIRKLRWRCRRGMKELDVLLERYLEARYPEAKAAEREAFERLLDAPDPELAALFFGRIEASQPVIADVVERIRTGG